MRPPKPLSRWVRTLDLDDEDDDLQKRINIRLLSPREKQTCLVTTFIAGGQSIPPDHLIDSETTRTQRQIVTGEGPPPQNIFTRNKACCYGYPQ